MTAVVLLLLLAGLFRQPGGAKAMPGPMAIVHATAIDGTGAGPAPDQTVLIVGRRITTRGPADDVPLPNGARVLDTSGKWVIPGLWDMHAHVGYSYPGASRDQLFPLSCTLYLANGVTGVRDMGGPHLDWLLRQRKALAAAPGAGPRIVAAGQGLDGPEPTDASKRAIHNPEHGREPGGVARHIPREVLAAPEEPGIR